MEDTKTPEKYIRTFHSDADVLQKGGIPDLAPLQRPLEAVVPPSPPSPPPPVSVPSPAIALPAPKPNPPETYSDDFALRMKEEHASTATVIAAEQDAAPVLMPPAPAPRSYKNLAYSVIGVLLLVAGAGGMYVAYGRYLSALAPVVLLPSASVPIFVDERDQLSGTGTALTQAVMQAAGRPLAGGSVRLLSPEATTTTVFLALQPPAPNILIRNIAANGSMAGVVSAGGTQGLFFILAVSSYSNTFAGMLSWEPRLPRDLAKLFPPYPEAASATSTATSTIATSTSPALAAGFTDASVANHDVRIYRDTAGRTVLLYGYWNRSTLVIARNEAIFSEVLHRLATTRAPQ